MTVKLLINEVIGLKEPTGTLKEEISDIKIDLHE